MINSSLAGAASEGKIVDSLFCGFHLVRGNVLRYWRRRNLRPPVTPHNSFCHYTRASGRTLKSAANRRKPRAAPGLPAKMFDSYWISKSASSRARRRRSEERRVGKEGSTRGAK